MDDNILILFHFPAGVEWNCLPVATLHSDYRLSQMAAASDVDYCPMYTAQLCNVFAQANGLKLLPMAVSRFLLWFVVL